MKKVAVKICGITNQEDASLAVELGADALGFIFADSPRQITPQKARHIIRTVPSLVKKIGVFVDEVPTAIKKIIGYCGLDLVQLHGKETPNLCQELMPHTIKAFRINNEASLQAIQKYQGKVKALLLDTYSRNKAGGTGNTFDWRIAVNIKNLGIPIILAGGLSPAKIGDRVTTLPTGIRPVE